MNPIESLVSAVFDFQRSLYDVLAGQIKAADQGLRGTVAAVLLALALGAVHALTPGHGKAVVFTYFLGTQARAAAGFWMACKVAASHVLSAAVLVALFGSAASMFGRPTGVARWLQVASYAVIVMMGIWFLARAIADARSQSPPHVHAHSHTGLLPFSVGSLPCPMTMLILTYAIANSSLLIGALLALFLGVGIAATISVIGSAGILFRRGVLGGLNRGANFYRRLIDWLQIGSSAAIVVLGAVFLAGALKQ